MQNEKWWFDCSLWIRVRKWTEANKFHCFDNIIMRNYCNCEIITWTAFQRLYDDICSVSCTIKQQFIQFYVRFGAFCFFHFTVFINYRKNTNLYQQAICMYSTCASIMFLYLIRNTANQISNPLTNSLARYNGVHFPKIEWNN